MNITAQDWLTIRARSSALICWAGDGSDAGDAATGDGGDGGDAGDGGDDQKNQQSALINSAVSSHLSRFRKSFERDVASAITSAVAPLAEQLAKLGGGNQDDKAAASKGKDELAKAMARIDELERSNKEAIQRAEATEKARLSDEEKIALQKVLVAKGIEPGKLRAAVALLYTEDKRVGRDESGNIVFRIPKAGYTDEVTLDEGVAAWLKDDEGKSFLPARGAAGSGAAGSQIGGAGKKATTKQEKIEQARRNLAQLSGIRIHD